MNAKQLRFVDRRLGGPLTRVLTVLRYVGRPFCRRTGDQTPRRVAVIKLSEMGSSVLAYPALAQLKRRCPVLDLYVLSFDSQAPIFDALALAPPEHTLRVDTRSAWRLAWTGWRAMCRLRALHVDTVIDMEFFSRLSKVAAFLICPRGNRVGFHRFTNEGQDCGNLLTHRVLYSPHIHTSQAFLALVEALFASHTSELLVKQSLTDRDYSLPVLTPSPDAIAGARRALVAAGLPPAPGAALVLINPNSSSIFPLRKWPARHFIALCRDLLAARPDIQIALTGGADEEREAGILVQQVGNPRCVSLAGQTTLFELLALYHDAQLLVTNDSGPAHFASLTPLRTIVLFGPETPALYAPLGGRALCLYKHFACSPCVSVYNAKHSPCRNNRCLQAIGVAEVLGHALAVLDAAAETPAQV